MGRDPGNLNETRPALLDQASITRMADARFERRVRRTQCRMPRERQFAEGRENARTIIRPGMIRRQHKGGFGKVGPARDGLHPPGTQSFGIQHDGNRISKQRRARKDINRAVSPAHGHHALSPRIHEAVNSHPAGVLQYQPTHAAKRLATFRMRVRRSVCDGASRHGAGMHGVFMAEIVSHDRHDSDRHTGAETRAVQRWKEDLYWFFFWKSVTVRLAASA